MNSFRNLYRNSSSGPHRIAPEISSIALPEPGKFSQDFCSNLCKIFSSNFTANVSKWFSNASLRTTSGNPVEKNFRGFSKYSVKVYCGKEIPLKIYQEMLSMILLENSPRFYLKKYLINSSKIPSQVFQSFSAFLAGVLPVVAMISTGILIP